MEGTTNDSDGMEEPKAATYCWAEPEIRTEGKFSARHRHEDREIVRLRLEEEPKGCWVHEDRKRFQSHSQGR
jgi:hypothetical protein